MLSFESNNSVQSITVILDTEGIDELIEYLNYIRSQDESLHLISGNELANDALTQGLISIPHVKLVFLNSGSL